jgi:trk system potassium uptake protein TrkA
MEVAVPPRFEGRSLRQLRLRERFGIYVIAVKEMVPERFSLLPGADFVLKSSDMLVIVGREGGLQRLEKEGGAE